MNHLRVYAGIGFFVIGLGCAGPAVERAPTAEHLALTARAAAATSLVERWSLGVEARMKAGLGWGYVAALRENGKSMALAAGKRTLEPVTPLAPRDLLEIGSVSKTFTGILIHLAEAEGKLRLDQPLADFFPALAASDAGKITVRELGLHRSGLPREPHGITIPEPTNPRRGLKKAELLEALAREKIAPLPAGQAERPRDYSNWGYITLGILLEQVYGRALPQLFESRVLGPLGMRESGVDRKTRRHRKIVAKAAAGFALNADARPLRDYESFAAATGGIESNAVDVGRFLEALESPPRGKLGQAITASLVSGIGWDSAPGVSPMWKNGETSAHTAYLSFDRERRRGVFIGANTIVSPDEFGLFVLGAPEDTLLGLTRPIRTPPTEEIDRLKGVFRNRAAVNGDFGKLEVFETFGRIAARGHAGKFEEAALLVAEPGEDEWKLFDGYSADAYLELRSGGVRISRRKSGKPEVVYEFEKVLETPEKYPALEE